MDYRSQAGVWVGCNPRFRADIPEAISFLRKGRFYQLSLEVSRWRPLVGTGWSAWVDGHDG